MTLYICPVCGYPDLPDEPRSAEGGASHEICPSCGFQFGFSDDSEGHTYESWRARWVASGMPWDPDHDGPPAGWNPQRQLDRLLGFGGG